MKNKGFTLVELLAVIVILGLILGIAIPKATKTLEQKKQHLYELTINELIETTKKYVTSNPKIYSDISKYGSLSINVKTLCEEKLIDCPVTDPRNKESINGSIKIEYLNNEYVYTFSNNAEGIILAFDLNGGTASDAGFSENLTVQPYELVSYPNVAKTDFRLKNWSLVSGDAEILTEGIKARSRNSVVKAIWVKDVLVTLNLNGGETTQTLNSSYETYEQIKLENPTRKNYTFIGWKIESGDSILAGNNLVVGTSATTITALWKLNTINLSIDLQGGTIEIDPTGAYDTGEDIVLKEPIKHGYTFSHWQVVNGNSILSGNVITMGTQATTIKAVWIKKVTITLDLDEGLTTQTLNSNYTTGLTITLETPTKSGFIFAGWTIVSGDSAISGNSLTVGTLDTTIKANWIANNYDFAYTGSEQTFTAPVSGYYKLEVWGAQGGNVSGGSNGGTVTGVVGGYGGYSNGTIYLNEGDKIYINIGGQGVSNCVASTGQILVTCAGGYNGGGQAKTADTYGYVGSGGGATHIAKVSGLLSTLETKKESILIVAGGGGGAMYYNYNSAGAKCYGGSGGGESGTSGYKNTVGTNSSVAGTQTSGAGFGIGGEKSSPTGDNHYAGGGAGYYGGMVARSDGSAGAGAAGGSGYIGNSLLTNKVMYCYNCTALDTYSTKTATTTCTNETATENCPKIGSGYAKISYISDDIAIEKFDVGSKEKFFYSNSEQTFIAPLSGNYQLEVWGAQGGNVSGGSNGGTVTGVVGGYGGYSNGTIYLNEGDKIYINIGGQGVSNCVASTGQILVTCAGGYNGGGQAKTADTYGYVGSGGGATHIAKVSGLLSTLETKKESILIVAGGGGGAMYYNYNSAGAKCYGGSGGGESGTSGYKNTVGTNSSVAGTQTSGAGFGIGGEKSSPTGDNHYAGGGAGYYGGMVARSDGSAGAGAAGGSGYIGNSLLTNKVMYCYNCTASSEEPTKTISTTCANGSATENCAKKGNGFAIITLLSE